MIRFFNQIMCKSLDGKGSLGNHTNYIPKLQYFKIISNNIIV